MILKSVSFKADVAKEKIGGMIGGDHKKGKDKAGGNYIPLYYPLFTEKKIFHCLLLGNLKESHTFKQTMIYLLKNISSISKDQVV